MTHIFYKPIDINTGKYLESKTDLDRTREFLDSLGVLYSVNPLKDSRRGLKFGRPSGCFGDDYPECDKVGGYTGFSTQFEFNKNGKFLTVGAWE